MKPERRTRQESIDLELARAGWAIGSRRLIEEFVVETSAVLNEPGGLYRTPNEFADYALLDRLGRVLAIVEAKRSSRDALEGERQAADYADALRAKTGSDPFVFLANGDEIWFWHRRLYPPRKVSGFFTEEDLARLAHLDKYGKSLTGEMPRSNASSIAPTISPRPPSPISSAIFSTFPNSPPARNLFHRPLTNGYASIRNSRPPSSCSSAPCGRPSCREQRFLRWMPSVSRPSPPLAIP
jgi:hypothetical protein